MARRIWTFAAENFDVTSLALNGAGVAPSITGAQKRTGNYAYDCSLAASCGVAVSTNAVRVGFWLRHGTPIGDDNNKVPVISLTVGATKVRVWWRFEEGKLSLQAGYAEKSTTERYPVNAVPDEHFAANNVWHHIGLMASLDGSGFISFYCDKQRMLHWSGDTGVFEEDSETALYAIDGVYVLGCDGDAAWNNVYLDDYYIDDLESGGNSIPLTKRFYPLSVVSNNTVQLTPNTGLNFAAVNNFPHDSDLTYVGGNIAAKRDTYNTNSASGMPYGYTPTALIMDACVRKVADVASQLKFVTQGPIAATVSDAIDLGTGYAYIQQSFPNATDGTEWDAAKLDSTAKGFELAGVFA